MKDQGDESASTSAASGDPPVRIDDVACPVCGCLCDDLSVTVRQNRIEEVRNACTLAEPWFQKIRTGPIYGHSVRGQSADLKGALSAAGKMLRASRAPLIYGLSRSSTPGQRAAIALAERLGAVVDTTASVCHGPSIMAIQEVGESTCSLGEVRQRADLVVYWGCDPVRSHPRHLERYSAEPSSEFLPRGRSDRKLVVVDTVETDTSRLADHQFKVTPGGDFELISRLRGLLRGHEDPGGDRSGLSPADVQKLFNLFTRCRYGAIFFGLGIAQSRLGHLTVAHLLRMVAELNVRTRFIARRMRIPGDVAGADSVLCWQTGFPFAVDLARGYPRYNPGEFTANDLLERGDVDCCLFVGSEAASSFSPAAQAALRALPTIALESPHEPGICEADVRITTAVYGIHIPGTGYRMDEIPIPMRSCISTTHPTDEEVLNRLIELLDGFHNLGRM